MYTYLVIIVAPLLLAALLMAPLVVLWGIEEVVRPGHKRRRQVSVWVLVVFGIGIPSLVLWEWVRPTGIAGEHDLLVLALLIAACFLGAAALIWRAGRADRR